MHLSRLRRRSLAGGTLVTILWQMRTKKKLGDPAAPLRYQMSPILLAEILARKWLEPGAGIRRLNGVRDA
jgi:hypothetical protein